MNEIEYSRLEQRVAELEAKLARYEARYLAFLGGAGKRILKLLGIDPRELRP